MRATIKDVAKAAGVSPATVSLVLNKHSAAISEGTRARVLEAAKKLRYRPNQLAIGLLSQRTRTLGLIIPDFSNQFHTALCERIESYAEERGYSILIRVMQNDVEKTVRYLYDFDDSGVDGVVLTNSSFIREEDTRKCQEAIDDLHIPVLLIDRVPKEREAEAVLPNDRLGGYFAVRHLLELGHRRIGFVTGEMYLNNCVERLAGCRDALQEYGIELDPSLVYEGNFQQASGYDALPYMLGRGVTALFCFNDNIAYGVYRQMRNYNLHIPEDLSLVGFDDLIFSDLMEPPLTTLEYPVSEMARAAVEQLIGKIEGRSDAGTRQIYDPVLKVKGSTARPPADCARC